MRLPGPRVLVASLVLVLVVAGGVVLLVRHHRAGSCGAGEARVGAAEVPHIFESVTDAALRQGSGAGDGSGSGRLGRLVRAIDKMPFGRVTGAVGYDYGQWLNVGGLPSALAAWTKGNAVVGILGPDLKPRWGIRQARVQHAWDADASHFFQLGLAKDRPLEVSSYALSDGARRWCASVGTVPTRYDDPLGTMVLPDGDVLVLADAPGSEASLVRLSGGSGSARWSRTLDGIDRGDFLGDLGGGVGVAGGRPTHQLGDPNAPKASGAALTGFDEKTGHRLWSWGTGQQVHVIGASSGLLLIEQFDAAGRLELIALDGEGHQVWSTQAPAGTGADGRLADGVLVLRTATRFVGIDGGTGHPLWRTPYPPLPHQGQVFPYGFELSSQPMIDTRHLLLGTTTALRTLDVHTGRLASYRLPTDGINTSFWPYQLAVTDDLLVVATNIGAVAVRRDG